MQQIRGNQRKSGKQAYHSQHVMMIIWFPRGVCQENAIKMKCLQLRTPFNWVLMNLSLTELVIAVSGNTVLATNSFFRCSSITCAQGVTSTHKNVSCGCGCVLLIQIGYCLISSTQTVDPFKDSLSHQCFW